jgi:transcriptional regulator with PAS, ATPase and Fis domain
VAVNCAAIPESLIEAELFGYAPGAYTGAQKGGSLGRIREAEGGTLFLDEIGDMPLLLQTRLLRVLQEKKVTPLGGTPVPVDFALVSATHCVLADAVAEGRFRSDLYYRLNGFSVKLPALREREDFDALATRMLAQWDDSGVRIAPDLLAALRGLHLARQPAAAGQRAANRLRAARPGARAGHRLAAPGQRPARCAGQPGSAGAARR